MGELTLRVAARFFAAKPRYKGKTISEEGNVIYQYSERQIAHRNKKKAERIEKLKGNIEKLRSQVQKDLAADDPEKRLTALAVALIDHTYERVGNEESADEGHYGVTGWLKKHVKLNSRSATISYVGKAGVKHEKKVSDSKILKALREAYECVEGDDACLFHHEDGVVDAKKVNAYLKSFDVTAKDLRGFHANREMQDALRKVRSKGPELPRDRKEKDKILKKEFKEALDRVAEAVGHEPATLRSQYLVPKLEDTFMKNGEVLESFTKKAEFGDSPKPPLVFANRVVRMILDHLHGPDMVAEDNDYATIRLAFRKSGGNWEALWQGDKKQNELLKTIVNAWAQMPGRKRDVERSNYA